MSDPITFTGITHEHSDIIYALICELRQDQIRVDAHRFYIREGYQATHLRFTKPLAYE